MKNNFIVTNGIVQFTVDSEQVAKRVARVLDVFGAIAWGAGAFATYTNIGSRSFDGMVDDPRATISPDQKVTFLGREVSARAFFAALVSSGSLPQTEAFKGDGSQAGVLKYLRENHNLGECDINEVNDLWEAIKRKENPVFKIKDLPREFRRSYNAADVSTSYAISGLPTTTDTAAQESGSDAE